VKKISDGGVLDWVKATNNPDTRTPAVGPNNIGIGGINFLVINEDKTENYSKDLSGSAFSPSYQNGLYAVNDSEEKLWLFDANNLTLEMEKKLSADNMPQTAIFDPSGEKVYSLTKNGVVHGISLNESDWGTEVMTGSVSGRPNNGMSLVGDTLFLNTEEPLTYAMDKETGDIKDTYETGLNPGAITAQMNSSGNPLLHVGEDLNGKLRQLELVDGKFQQNWMLDSKIGSNVDAVSSTNDMVYIGSGKAVYGIRLRDGAIEFKHETDGYAIKEPTPTPNGLAYVDSGFGVKFLTEKPDKCVPEAVAGSDGTIDLTEIQQAINWWAEGAEVPDTGGETISLSEIQYLIDTWAEGNTVSC
jgi:hypothetical protein